MVSQHKRGKRTLFSLERHSKDANEVTVVFLFPFSSFLHEVSCKETPFQETTFVGKEIQFVTQDLLLLSSCLPHSFTRHDD